MDRRRDPHQRAGHRDERTRGFHDPHPHHHTAQNHSPPRMLSLFLGARQPPRQPRTAQRNRGLLLEPLDLQSLLARVSEELRRNLLQHRHPLQGDVSGTKPNLPWIPEATRARCAKTVACENRGKAGGTREARRQPLSPPPYT